jgi:hypothetical protein
MADREEAHKAKDDELCREFLAGNYLEPGSHEEKEARAALARRIRDQMPISLTRELLALAIDPDTKSSLPNMAPTRKIKFENPTTGHASTWRRDAEIRYLIERKYLPEEAAKATARVLKSYRKISDERPLRRLIEAVERARTGHGVLEAVYARVAKVHGISRRAVQRIWRGK